MSHCENCKFFTEKPVVDKTTGETYYEPECKMGVTLTSQNVVYVKNCEDFQDENEKPNKSA